jgi:hypothetical protein
MDGRFVQETYEHITKLDRSFVYGMFREEFWTDVVPTYGNRPLIPRGAPTWILTKPKREISAPTSEAERESRLNAFETRQQDFWDFSHADDPELSGWGRRHLDCIIRRQKGFKIMNKKHDSSNVLKSLRNLWPSTSVVDGGHCKTASSQ